MRTLSLLNLTKRETAHSLSECSYELKYMEFLSADCLIFLIQFVTVSVLIVLRLKRQKKNFFKSFFDLN